MILDRRINKEQQEKQLSTNLARVFVLYITPPKVQNEDPVNIDRKSIKRDLTWFSELISDSALVIGARQNTCAIDSIFYFITRATCR